MSHHGREYENDRIGNQQDMGFYYEGFIRAREAIKNYIDSTWTADQLREFAIITGIIVDPDKAVKAAQSKIDKINRELEIAKAELLSATNTRKCNGNE